MVSHRIFPSFLDTVLQSSGGRPALLIGNGVHRYNASFTGNDWNAMTHSLAAKYQLANGKELEGLALTELFDLIDLKIEQGEKAQKLQEEFCDGMGDWRPSAHHQQIANWAIAHQSPLLTTNFDQVLSDSVGATLHTLFQPRGSLKGPTDYYPWEKYFARDPLVGPCDGFGIWHVNGLVHHIRSIRLGLTHYMGSVSRARPWIHGDKETRLFHEKNMAEWRGRDTWLHIVFNMPLLIFGLQLGAQEVFLRWLLIERAKYFRQYPQRRKPAWYVHVKGEKSQDDKAKYFFLHSIGIEPIAVESYEAIYGHNVWNQGV